MFILSIYSQAYLSEKCLIHWGIVIHGFIDGYSQLITGLYASNSNLSTTVLDLFLAVVCTYGVPSHVWSDHSIKNILLMAWMELYWGGQWGSYIWGWYVILILWHHTSNLLWIQKCTRHTYWASLGQHNCQSWGNLVRILHTLRALIQPWH